MLRKVIVEQAEEELAIVIQENGLQLQIDMEDDDAYINLDNNEIYEVIKELIKTQDFYPEEIAELYALIQGEDGDTGINIIARERQRQVTEEGWTEEHDDTHNHGELADAAACYAMRSFTRTLIKVPDFLWPFEGKWWKKSPNDRIKELAKAGALIAADIDRLKRLERKAKR